MYGVVRELRAHPNNLERTKVQNVAPQGANT